MIDGWSTFNRGTVLLLGDWGAGWIVAFTLASALVLAATWLDLTELRRPRRFVLLGIRTIVLATAVLLLLEPALELKHVRVVPNHVAVMVDDSLSQTLPSGQGATRTDAAQDALERLAPQLDGQAAHIVAWLDLGGAAVDPSTFGAQRAVRDETALLEAMERFAESVDDVGGFVIVSDGIDRSALGRGFGEDGALDADLLARLEALQAPVHTVATAPPDGLRDLAIRQVIRDDYAFVRNAVSVSVDVGAYGFSGETVDVTLYREGLPLRTERVRLPEDGSHARVEFAFVPETIGKEHYHVAVPVFEGEALTRNNRSDFVLQVIRDQIRALQVVGHPSWDVRFLRQLLTGNPNVDLISFFILRTVDDLRRAPNSAMSLIPFPTRELFDEQLGSFDVVIFQNFDYGPYEMAQYLPAVQRYVEGGGGFMMVGGDRSFASGGYAGTAVATILPVTLPGGTSEAMTVDPQAFRPTLTDAGQRHPITRLAFDARENRTLWETLPLMPGTNIVTGVLDDATVLATHPTRRAGDDAMPVIAVREVGEGRSMAITVDSSWRWSFEGVREGAGADPYAAFYQSAIRWLIRDPELNLVQVELRDETVRPGEALEGTVRVFEPDYQPAVDTTVTLRWTWRPLEGRADDAPLDTIVETNEVRTDDQGVVAIAFVPEQEGVYRVEAVVAHDEGADDRDDEIVLALESAEELRDILPRPELLRALSDATAGRHAASLRELGTLRFAPPRVEEVDRREVIELWSSPLLLLLLALLLGAEWTLRRHWGRL